MNDHGVSAELESVRCRFSIEQIFHVVWCYVHLVMPSFNQHLQFYLKLLDVGILAFKDDFVPPCNYFEFRKIAAESLQILVCCSIDLDRIDGFQSDVFLTHLWFLCFYLLCRSVPLHIYRYRPFCHIPMARAIPLFFRCIPRPEPPYMSRGIPLDVSTTGM